MNEMIEYLENFLRQYGCGEYTKNQQLHLEKLKEQREKIMLCSIPKYKVTFSNLSEDDKIIIFKDNIVVPEEKAYSFIFSLKGNVNDDNINSCKQIAILKVLDAVERRINQYKIRQNQKKDFILNF